MQPNVVYVQPRGLDTNPMSDQVFTYPYDGTAENAAKVGAKAFMDLQEQFPEMSQRESIFGASDDTGMREYRLEMNQFADEVAVYSKKGERVGVTPAIETAPPKVGNTGAIPTDEEAARWDAAEAYIRPKIAAMEGDALDAFGKSVGVKRQGVSDEAYRERILGNTHPDDLLDALAGDSERFQTSPELDNLLPYENTNIERRDVATAVARLASRIEADRTREDGGDVSQRSEADAQSLLSWAESEGRIIREDDFRKLIDTLPDRAGEAEHDVFTLRDANRVVKLTRPPTFGSQGDLLTYIENIERSNELFSDDVTLHGVVQTANGPALVTSQLYIAGSRPTQVEIDNWFRSQGYESTGFNRWKNPSTGAEVADTHEGNLIKLPNGGMVPIDVQVLSAGESDIRFQATPENIQFLQSLTNTPATYEYTPYDENRERIRQYAEAQGITLVRTDSPFLGATARRIYETYGVEPACLTGGSSLGRWFSPESSRDIIFNRGCFQRAKIG